MSRPTSPLEKAAYAGLFCLALPAALQAWGAAGQIVAPPVAPAAPFAFAALAGAGLLGFAAWTFIRGTGRLPLSIDRPQHAVTAGAYAILGDPLYVGFALLTLGVFGLERSRFGVFVAAPALAAATAAFVLGYEAGRRPRRAAPAALDPPQDLATPATARDHRAFAALAALASAAAILAAAALGPASSTLATLIGLAAAALAPAMARRGTARDLRRALLSVALACGGWTLFTAGGGPATSTPAFAAGAGLGACAFALGRGPRLLTALAVTAAAGSLAPDGMLWAALGLCVGAGLPLAHRTCLAAAQGVANSWSAVRIGPVRVINYAAYACAAGAVGAAIFLAVLPGAGAAALTVSVCTLAGAGLWGAAIESTGRLARPFGYFGAMLAAAAGVALASAITGPPALVLAAAGAVGAPWVQAIGRLRCLVQGCCHGRPVVPPGRGLRYLRAESRVTRLSDLGGAALHPTPLYSVYGNLALGVLLWRLFEAGQPAPLLVGVYLIGAGVFRLVEEAFRGEPQTRIVFDLRLYQWLAIAEAGAGALASTVSGPALGGAHRLDLGDWIVVLLCGAAAGVAMGVDLPGSGRRFSRLTPG